MPAPGKGEKGKDKHGRPAKSKGKGFKDGSTAANASYGGPPQIPSDAACKFFGSVKGCQKDVCPFSHSSPNSVPLCTFLQRGQCDKGAACTFRHQQWSSPDEAISFYDGRDRNLVEQSAERYKQIRRGASSKDKSAGERLCTEHVELEGEIEKDFQEETYGSNAMRMMEKMGYKAGSGLGKENQGRTSLLGSCVALEHSSGTSALGFSHYAGAIRVTAAERAARLADARAKKCQKLDNTSFVHHNLLSSDESSEDDPLVKSRDVKLR